MAFINIPEKRHDYVILLYSNIYICKTCNVLKTVLYQTVNTENEVGAVGFLPWFAPAFSPYYLIRADSETNEPIRNKDGFCSECDYGR